MLVNNAGRNDDGPFLEMTDDVWHDVLQTNLSGPFFTARTFAGAMLNAGGGSIVNIGATTGIRPRFNGVNYCASKAAPLHLTKCLALELAPTVRVNCLIPGMIDTEDMRMRVQKVTVREVGPPDCFTALDAGELDVVVTVNHRDGPTHTDARYDRMDVLFDPLLVALPVGHALTGRAAVDLGDLADARWVLGANSGPCARRPGSCGCTAPGRRVVRDAGHGGGRHGCGVGVGTRRDPGGRDSATTAGHTLYVALRDGAAAGPLYRMVLDVLRERAVTVASQRRAEALR